MKISRFFMFITYVTMAVGIGGAITAAYLGHRHLAINILNPTFFITGFSMVITVLTSTKFPGGIKIVVTGFCVMVLGDLVELLFKDNFFSKNSFFIAAVIIVVGVVVSMFQIGQKQQW